jgi:hypothetical protein
VCHRAIKRTRFFLIYIFKLLYYVNCQNKFYNVKNNISIHFKIKNIINNNLTHNSELNNIGNCDIIKLTDIDLI